MNIVLEIFVLLSLLTFLAVSVGRYMGKVFYGHKVLLTPIIRPLEKLLYILFRVDEEESMDWKKYATCFAIFNLVGIITLFFLQEIQKTLPFNPENFTFLKYDTSLNNAISFVTNTNWQSYSSESTLSYLTQMLGLTVQNFMSAAMGISAGLVIIRAFAQKPSIGLGNFWIDFTRSILYILLPLAIVFSIILVSQGVIQNLNPYVHVNTLEGKTQIIAQGPAASQVAIKLLGTNGGGFFNTNSAHPYENPTPMSDYFQIIALLLIPTSLFFTFGSILRRPRQAWVLFFSVMALFLIGLFVSFWAESANNPIFETLGIETGSNMEGKESRFGILNSVFFAQSTTATSCGAVNNMHDSLMPITGLVLMFNMMIGEVIFGGAGVGLIGLLAYGILTMFLVGLMIGRTPEIFGKKLESFEMIMTVCLLMIPSLTQLILGSIAISTEMGLASIDQPGPHGLSRIIYAFASGAGNNGSAFGGLKANTPFYNLTIACAMILGRFATIIPAFAIAGSLVNKKPVPFEVRFPTESPLFGFLLVSVIITVGALTFFPILVMGPFLEHLFLHLGETF